MRNIQANNIILVELHEDEIYFNLINSKHILCTNILLIKLWLHYNITEHLKIVQFVKPYIVLILLLIQAKAFSFFLSFYFWLPLETKLYLYELKK